MIVLSGSNNNYPFPNMTFDVIDYTTQVEGTASTENQPAFNFLIPIVTSRGPVNQMSLFRPGDKALAMQMYGRPNPQKDGFGMTFICDILDRLSSTADVGVYTINLRDNTSTAPTAIVLMKWKVEEGVQRVDADGNPLYTDSVTGAETTVSTGNEPIVRDVLHVKYETTYATNITKWPQMINYLSTLYSDAEDEAGYKTYPLFGLVYRGNSTYGNNCYMRIVSQVSQYDSMMYYAFEVFDGDTTITTDAEISFDPDATTTGTDTAFAETIFNDTFSSMAYVSSPYMDDIKTLLNTYVTGGDYKYVDIFAVGSESDQFVVDSDSEDFTAAKAIQFAGGSDGDLDKDKLFTKFFRNQIVTDVMSTLRYRFHYVPDVGYASTPDNAETDVIGAIKDFVNNRIMTTSAAILVGGENTFMSAINEHYQQHADTNMPNMIQFCRYQNPMKYDSYINRTITYPFTYFDTMTLVDRLNTDGNLYSPMAGANYRVSGYIEDTMNYAPEDPDLMTDLENARINVVMKDADTGGYLSNQLLCTKLISDRTERNNAFIISDMIYDLIQLIHVNSFTFNEAEEVAEFSQLVDEQINSRYAKYTASMTCEVSRKGTTGRASQTKIIKITIDLRDIAKYANTYLTLVDN